MKFEKSRTVSVVSALIMILLVCVFVFWQLNKSYQPIKIGFAGGLTGATSEIGVTGRNGALLAVNEINKAGGVNGRKIELLVVDDKNSPVEALAADKKLIDRGVNVIIGHLTSEMAIYTVPYANQQGVLMVSPTISCEELSGLDDNFLRVIPSNSVQGICLAEAAFHRENAKNTAIIYDRKNERFTRNVIKAFEARMQEYGGKVACLIELSDAHTDSLIAAIHSSGAEAVLIIASSVEAALMCQYLRKNNISLPILLPMWAMTNDLIKQGGEAVEGVYAVNQEDVDSLDDDYLRFKQRYKEEYGGKPTFSSMLSYNAVKVVAEAMRSAKDITPAALKAEIIKRKIFKALQGPVEFDQYGDTYGNYYLYTVKDGAFQKVGN